jgi:hypothetical protein
MTKLPLTYDFPDMDGRTNWVVCACNLIENEDNDFGTLDRFTNLQSKNLQAIISKFPHERLRKKIAEMFVERFISEYFTFSNIEELCPNLYEIKTVFGLESKATKFVITLFIKEQDLRAFLEKFTR